MAQQVAGGASVPYAAFLTWRDFLDREPARRPYPERPAAQPSFRGEAPNVKAFGFLYAGSMTLLVGWIWSLVLPINKRLWTSSYVLLSAGIACLVLAATYWLVDVKGYRRWTWPFLVFGTNTIAAYVSWLAPTNASLGYAISYVLLWLGLLSIPHRRRIFLRI